MLHFHHQHQDSWVTQSHYMFPRVETHHLHRLPSQQDWKVFSLFFHKGNHKYLHHLQEVRHLKCIKKINRWHTAEKHIINAIKKLSKLMDRESSGKRDWLIVFFPQSLDLVQSRVSVLPWTGALNCYNLPGMLGTPPPIRADLRCWCCKFKVLFPFAPRWLLTHTLYVCTVCMYTVCMYVCMYVLNIYIENIKII